MKKIITTTLLTLICVLGFSQNTNSKPTRQQTENWILDKINKYAAKEKFHSSDGDLYYSSMKTSISEKNIEFKIINNDIVVSSNITIYSRETFSPNQPLPVGETKTYSKTVNIPLDKIKSISVKDGYLVFDSDYKSILETDINSKPQYTSAYLIRFDQYGEQDFANRFNKAAAHLLSFIKKSKTTELF
jgi:hypothetical protein